MCDQLGFSSHEDLQCHADLIHSLDNSEAQADHDRLCKCLCYMDESLLQIFSNYKITFKVLKLKSHPLMLRSHCLTLVPFTEL